MKNSNDTIGDRTRDLPTCIAVPQPTAPPRAPLYMVFWENKQCIMYVCMELNFWYRSFTFKF
jgi:hypothetical protein